MTSSSLLWQPSPLQAAHSQMAAFMQYISWNHAVSIADYQGLYAWSIQYPEKFWVAIWEFCQIRSSRRWDQVLVHPEKMPGARWFVGARLNFAENLLGFYLKHRHEPWWIQKPALISENEIGARRCVTYEALYRGVAGLAAGLRTKGVRAGDRVAGFMPNIVETVLAMLAVTSLGAIWTACSPDFGEHAVYDRFSQIQPKVLFIADGYSYQGNYYSILEKVKKWSHTLPSIEHIIVVPYLEDALQIQGIEKAILYADVVEEQAELVFEQFPFDHPVYILYSSGTTGKPKCIVHGAGGVLLQHFKELRLHTDIHPSDLFFYFTTCGWMMWHWQVSALATGATVLLYDGSPYHPKKERLLEWVENEKISVFGTSAAYLSSLEKMGCEPAASYSLDSLRLILSTGSPLLPSHFDYVSQKIKKEVQLSSISGGSDIISCFGLGNPLLPVSLGEIQCRGLGMSVAIYNAAGESVLHEKGELVCTAPFPVMPIYFWDDPEGKTYQGAYFNKFPHVWAHGDYAEITERGGLIIYGRSDTVLNPKGVRIGTAEIYREVEAFPEICESVVIAQKWEEDVRIVLFIQLQPGYRLTETLKKRLRERLKANLSPQHVPAKIIRVPDIPKTYTGKRAELAVSDVVHGRPIQNKEALRNPDALEYFKVC